MHPENEWREQDESRPNSVYATLAPANNDENEAQLSAGVASVGLSSGPVEPISDHPVRSLASEQDLAAAAVEQALASEAAKLELEQEEHRVRQAEAEAQAAEQAEARVRAETEARAKWQAEEAERERLDGEERERLEEEERVRREAGERLRREEQRRAEAVAKAEEDRIREEEQAKAAAEAEEKHAREVQAVRDREEAERAAVEAKAADRQATKAQLVAHVHSAASADHVILSGHVTAQASDSLYWRRRFFQLRAASLSLFKAEDKGDGSALAVVELPGRVEGVVDSPEEAWGVMNCFKLAMKGGEDWLLFTDGAEDKELLVVGLKAAAGI